MIHIPFSPTAKHKEQNSELVLCQLPGLSCMGCCTKYAVKGRAAIERQLIRDTQRFKKTKDPHQFSFDSGPEVAKGSEICKTLIKEGNNVFCPAHPKSAYTQGIDMREFCCKGYWCQTMKAFKTWKRERQEAMIAFVRSKNYDWYTYSVANDTGASLKEFLAYEVEQEKKESTIPQDYPDDLQLQQDSSLVLHLPHHDGCKQFQELQQQSSPQTPQDRH